ncbi:MAG TPA: elongation factor P [Candidatus Azoamicus sp. OHIO1]
MCSYKVKDYKVGLRILIDKDPYVILENEFFKPGKGQAFNRLKLKNLKNGVILKKTIKIGEDIELADVIEKEVKFLYFDNNGYCFIDPIYYNYYEVENSIIGTDRNWVVEGLLCTILLWENEVLSIKLPKVVVLRVVSTEDVSRQSVSAKNFKSSILETGVSIKLPLFIKVNDLVRVDTEKGEYISRVF